MGIYMRIFAGVPQGGGVKEQRVVDDRRQFLANYVVTSSETMEIRTPLLYGDKQSVAGL